jgi:hypothetical protein
MSIAYYPRGYAYKGQLQPNVPVTTTPLLQRNNLEVNYNQTYQSLQPLWLQLY